MRAGARENLKFLLKLLYKMGKKRVIWCGLKMFVLVRLSATCKCHWVENGRKCMGGGINIHQYPPWNQYPPTCKSAPPGLWLNTLSWSKMEDEDEALLFLHVLYAQKKKKRGGVCIEDFSDDFFILNCRFSRQDFLELKERLELPEIIHCANGTLATGVSFIYLFIYFLTVTTVDFSCG